MTSKETEFIVSVITICSSKIISYHLRLSTACVTSKGTRSTALRENRFWLCNPCLQSRCPIISHCHDITITDYHFAIIIIVIFMFHLHS